MASKDTWVRYIRKACKDAGTYEPFFELVIKQLAGIMARRDQIQEEYKQDGCRPVIEHTNKGGNTNLVKNPLLVLINDCNQQALAYWRDLGLTPAGFKKLGNDTSAKSKKTGSFEELLSGIGV